MSTPPKLAAFTLGLAAVFGAALGIGTVVGPVGPVGDPTTAATTDQNESEDDGAHGHGG